MRINISYSSNTAQKAYITGLTSVSNPNMLTSSSGHAGTDQATTFIKTNILKIVVAKIKAGDLLIWSVTGII